MVFVNDDPPFYDSDCKSENQITPFHMYTNALNRIRISNYNQSNKNIGVNLNSTYSHQRKFKRNTSILKNQNDDDKRDLSARPIRIFVGTWNCAYQDPDESVTLKPTSDNEKRWTNHIYRPAQALYGVIGSFCKRVGQLYSGSVTYVKGGIGYIRKRTYCRLNGSEDDELFSDRRYITFINKSKKLLYNDSRTKPKQEQVALSTVSDENMFYLNTTTNSIQSYDVSYSLNPNRSRDLSKQHYLRDEDSWPINYSDVGFVRARRDAIQRRLADNTSQKDVFVESPIVPKYVSRKTDTNGFLVLDKSKTTFSPISERKVPVNHSKSPMIRLRQSTIQLKPLTEEDNEPLNDWIPMGYDIYIISLQETLSCGMFISITKYLLRQSNEDYVRIPLENDKLSGHGDGAFLKTKSTSIAAWIRKELLDSKIVEMGPSRSIPISRINRSKGLVTFQMKVYNHLVCVVGCHLPTGRKSREKAIKQVIGKLCYVYGVSGSSLHDVFHHILWTGDFNFRVSNISTRQALMLLNNGHVQELFCNDEFYSRGASLFADMKFEEGVVRFFPTYKMRDDRDVADHSKDNWADSAYHTLYETHWYKGGNVKDRVPSWTDRVLKWSIPELRTCLQIDDTTYTSVQPNDKNILLTSDHSPVGCGLALWPVKSPEMLVPRKNLSLIG